MINVVENPFLKGNIGDVDENRGLHTTVCQGAKDTKLMPNAVHVAHIGTTRVSRANALVVGFSTASTEESVGITE